MVTHSVIGMYDTMQEAENAIRALDRAGFPIQQVSVIGQNLQSERDVHGFVTVGDIAKVGAGTGAWVGGLFGLLVGAAVLFVPGFGPLIVVGPAAAWLLGGIEGAVVGALGGSILGGLIGLGVSKEHIVKYEEELKAGKYLVVAHGSPEDVARAQSVLHATGAGAVAAHGVAGAS
jgi:hypothetical protein